jgi:hypothetical protein
MDYVGSKTYKDTWNWHLHTSIDFVMKYMIINDLRCKHSSQAESFQLEAKSGVLHRV